MAGKDLALPDFTNRGVTRADMTLARFAGSRDIEDVFKEGAKHLAAQEMQAAKTTKGVELTNGVYEYTLKTTDGFKHTAYQRLEQSRRSPEEQEDYQGLHQQLMGQYNQHIRGIVAVGIETIAHEVRKDVIVPKPEKRGWFR